MKEVNTKEFDKYVNNFDMNDRMIHLKYTHTYRVVDYCRILAESLNLNEHDTFLAKTIGLLQVPYLIWLCVALYLNGYIYFNN